MPPFDGCTLVCEDPLHKVVGTALVRKSLDVFESLVGIEQRLYVNEDWHVHDGFIKDFKLVSKNQLFAELSSQPEKWIRVIDYQVYWGFYDPNFQFYLRFGLDEEEPDTMMFDLTSTKVAVERLAAELNSAFNLQFGIVDAKQYFDRNYGG